jgi:acyl-CoA reductase-like NAD-dependent aldehyde dehydrogenase
MSAGTTIEFPYIGGVREDQALALADRLESGIMRLNDPVLPFGGFKDSRLGNAYAEGEAQGATRTKRESIRFDLDARTPEWGDVALD